MKKIFILDAVNFLFRSYYAIAPMTNSKGESTHALYGFIRSIVKILSEFSPDYVVAVFDGPDNKKSRTDLYKEYKSHRKGMPEDLFPQWEKALEFCKLAGIPFLSVSGVEADDVIGCVTKWASFHSLESFICTSDKDLCQLVSDHVFVIHAHKDNLLIDADKVQELFGVAPSQIVDYLALIGDASDNIPGVEGIGPKTASALLQEYGSLEEIFKNTDKIPGKKGEVLAKNQEIAFLSKKLAELDIHVPIPNTLDFYQKASTPLEPLTQFYQEHQFSSFLKEQKQSPPSSKSTAHTISSREELSHLLKVLVEEKSICLDTETTDIHPMKASLVGIGLGYSPEKTWYVPMNGALSKEEVLDFLQKLFTHAGITFYGHNIKYDLHILCNEGLPLPNLDFDTILGSYLLTPHILKHNLDALSLERLHKKKIPIEELIGKGKNQISMNDVDPEKVGVYCCEDVECTIRLKKLFWKELEEKKLLSILQEIELPLIKVLFSMERRGIFVDGDKLQLLSKELVEKIGSLTGKIHTIAGEEFNISSPKQLSTILFEKLKLSPPKKTQTGFSTAADALESLKGKSPIIPLILEFRQLEKLRSTYVDSLPLEINSSTGRIHCNFNQSVAATGRLSCQDPNLQNIPIRSEEGKKIREAFRPEQKDWQYLSGDYSQIELRLLAHLSEDPTLIEAFESGEDVHAYTASLIFNTSLKEVIPSMRHKAKAVNFGILYGQQAYGLSQELGVDIKVAAHFIETYFQRYKKVKEYLESCKESARVHGFASTMTGRKRPIPDIHSKNSILKALAERLAINTPLQGSAADLIKIAMIQIQKHWEFKKSFCVLQIHDELLFEAPEEEIDTLSSFVKKHMAEAFSLKVPLEVDISVGRNWGEC
jgi:DNA polymerase-1